MATYAKVVASVLVVGLVVGSGVTAVLGQGGGNVSAPDTDDPSAEDGLATFDSASEYAQYVRAGRRASAGAIGGAAGTIDREVAATADTAAQTTAAGSNLKSSGGDGGAGDASRIGGANVQEQGIDEPDLVASVGGHFVYSPGGRELSAAVRDEFDRSDSKRHLQRDATVIDASEPAAPETVAAINASGELLRSGDTLVVLGSRQVTGYDVSDPANPTKRWTKALDSSIETARINGGQLYVVARTNAERPCPIEPMGTTEVACSDIHHPRVQINADATYTAYSIEPASGTVADATSFVGTARSTVVYMSSDALYVTYTKGTDRIEMATDYLVEEAEVVPADVKDRIREIKDYNISPESKRREMQRAVQGWFNSLSEERRETVRKRLRTGLRSYAKDRQRQLTRTGIVRIGVGDGTLAVDATGTVPGRPLDQFSMDQHDGTLRIATTIPQAFGAQSENDLYTLEATTLDRQGAAQGMGADQRIYAVRYVDDTAYMVTFRQVDPFHVVDLSNPQNPKELGNVKLPGFSNYLHPVGEDTILGIGEQDGQVKAVLFDVSDPANPTVTDSKVLDARWSAVSQTHHAFMQDARHGVAFLPAGEQGIVLDYTNGTLDVEKRVQLAGTPERARYVGDYLYVFSPAELTVLDETDWTAETTLDLNS